jgi:hypothetical protein
MLFQHARECLAGKLHPLVAVENLRFGLDQGPVERADTEITFQAVGDLPTDHESRKPVDDCYKVDESTSKPDLRDIDAPDVIGACNDHFSKQIQVDFMSLPRL